MIKAIPLIGIFTLSALACQALSFTDQFFEVPSGAVLYQDDFSDPDSGWENLSDENLGILEYFDGYYRIEVSGRRKLLYTGPGMNFNDVHLEADTIKVIGSKDDMYGLVCRAEDENNFYFFIISSDGYFGIGKMVNGEQVLIDMPGMLPSEVISQGKAINHLRADCISDRLDFYVNGKKLKSVKDSDFINGDVGLINGNLRAAKNVVLFDNFSVLNP
jgi:hypothetical protein